MKLNGKIKRAGIYSFYDKDGIVDRYVEYFLNDFRKNLDILIVVSNGDINDSGKEKINKYANDIIIRENKGFDIWGYKTGLDSLGWEKLQGYDEVVVANNTMMGPVYPFSGMFEEMAERDLDFWGITRHYSFDFDPFGSNEYGYIPEHIQSNFMVFRSSMIESKEFQEYWNNLPELETYEDAVGKHESSFTKRFADKGFAWDTYVDTSDIEYLNQYPLMVYPKLLIKEKKCPIFKRRTFFQPYTYMLNNTTGQPAMELMQYLKESGLYDTDMIWENILRTCNQADFVKNLQLRYVLPSNMFPVESDMEKIKGKKIALIMHLYFEDLIDSSFAYAQAIPENADVYITTNTEQKKQSIEKKFKNLKCNKLDVRVIENRGRDVSSVLVGVKDVIMDYDIACFVHDKKTAQLKPGSVGDSFAYKCFENTLHNKEYVCNIIKLFMDEPRLGLLSPMVPNHGDFFPTLGLEWGANFENTKELAAKLNINVPMDEKKEPIAPLGTFFWFRPKAFSYLYEKDWEYEDFPQEPNNLDGTLLHAVERIYPFAVQQAGYYPAIAMVDKGAAIELTNLEYYTREYNKVLLDNHMGNYQYVMVDNLRSILDGNAATPVHEQLRECMETHQRVCEEWTATAEALKSVSQEYQRVSQQYQSILNSKSWKMVSGINRIIDKIKGK